MHWIYITHKFYAIQYNSFITTLKAFAHILYYQVNFFALKSPAIVELLLMFLLYKCERTFWACFVKIQLYYIKITRRTAIWPRGAPHNHFFCGAQHELFNSMIPSVLTNGTSMLLKFRKSFQISYKKLRFQTRNSEFVNSFSGIV